MMMNQIIDFLTLYWQQILDAVILIISVIICLIRKRPCINEMDSITKDVLDLLPTLISLVEKDGHGYEKKSAVLTMVSQYVKEKYHIDCPVEIVSLVDRQIENILSTPRKKGE